MISINDIPAGRRKTSASIRAPFGAREKRDDLFVPRTGEGVRATAVFS